MGYDYGGEEGRAKQTSHLLPRSMMMFTARSKRIGEEGGREDEFSSCFFSVYMASSLVFYDAKCVYIFSLLSPHSPTA